MSEQQDLKVFQANMDSALRRFHGRTGHEAVSTDMPFDALLEAESDGIEGGEGGAGEYEYLQRTVGIRAAFRYLTAEGDHPLKIMKRLYALGRAMHVTPFCLLTMDEVGVMFSETKAAHSFRMKWLSGQIEKAGMKGSRLPGQKTKSSTPNYSACQKGNQNRKGGKGRRRRRSATGSNGHAAECLGSAKTISKLTQKKINGHKH